MPYAPKHVCAYTGCRALVSDPSSGYCEQHRVQYQRQYNHARGAERTPYDSAQWKAVRAAHLLEYPYCERCITQGKFVPAAMVHHKKPVNQFPDLFLVDSNLESLCWPCHNVDHPEKGGRHD